MALGSLLSLTRRLSQQYNGIGNSYGAIILNEIMHLNQMVQSAVDLSLTMRVSSEAS